MLLLHHGVCEGSVPYTAVKGGLVFVWTIPMEHLTCGKRSLCEGGQLRALLVLCDDASPSMAFVFRENKTKWLGQGELVGRMGPDLRN